MTPADLLTSPGPESPPRATFAPVGAVTATLTDPGLAALLSPGGLGLEPFRVLRTKIKAAFEGMSMVETVLGEHRSVRCLGLVSATAREGTTAVTLGLAAALAQEPECRVLLVEAVLRAPAMERALGLASEQGLSEWLRGGGEGLVPFRRVDPWGFFLLPGGAPSPQSAELLSSEPMVRLLTAARRSFDVVLLDCPPLETVADSVILQDLLDGFVLVVRARHASRDSIRQAVSDLRPNLVKGVVFNDRTEIVAPWLDRRRASSP